MLEGSDTERWDAGQVGCWTKVIQERRDAGKEGCRKEGMRDAGKEGFRRRGMHNLDQKWLGHGAK